MKQATQATNETTRAKSIPPWVLKVKDQCPWATVAHIQDVAAALGSDAYICNIISEISEDLELEDETSLTEHA